MRAGLVLLVVAYGFSQFFRAFLAVLTPVLGADLGAAPDDLATASGIWFLTFAVMQIPVGEALDRIGPRLTAAVIFLIGTGGGAAWFAMAASPMDVSIAMGLIGIGCSPILMAAYFILARSYPPKVFATLGAAMIGFGSLGNIGSSAPLAWSVEALGWRGTLWVLAAVAVLVALMILIVVRDPPRVAGARGSVLDVLRIRAIWPVLIIMLVCYAPGAALRGLWAGPYLRDAFGAGADMIGYATLAMGLAMILGNFVYGPLDQILGSRKRVILGGNALLVVALVALSMVAGANLWLSIAMLALIGALAQSFPVVMAHGRAFLPPHLTGRGVTLLNLFGIGGAGIMQVVTGPIWRSADMHMKPVTGAYQVLFLFFAVTVTLGLVVYWFSRDATE